GVLIVADHLDANLGHQIHLVLGATVDLGVPALPAVSARFAHRHPVHAERLQRRLDVIELERLYDSRHELHGTTPFHRLFRRCLTGVSAVQSEYVRDVKQERHWLRQCFLSVGWRASFRLRPGSYSPPRIASTNVSGSNGARSSGPSPSPASF